MSPVSYTHLKDNVKITKGAKSISILEPVEYTRADGSPGISYNVKKAAVSYTHLAPELIIQAKQMDLLTYLKNYEPVSYTHLDVYKRQKKSRAVVFLL